MTNFQISLFKDRALHNRAERILLHNIFRHIWPELKGDFLMLVPEDSTAPFTEIPDREVKYRRTRITFKATMERVDEQDYIYIVPNAGGDLLTLERIRRNRHVAKKPG